MSTSLAEQLRRLATPQTSILQDSKKRPSILFDVKEAATKDRQTIFDLGLSGLHELTNLNPIFHQFEKTLFQKSSVNMQRAVETSEVNKKLDETIKKFFYCASPYFMLHPTHLCLEWLIRRYNIHQFNRDEFMALILPYHETKIFVKCVQLLVLKNPNDNWYWLKPIQKPGVPLPKSTIINRAGSENFFLQLICKNTVEAVKELDTKAHMLQTAINFYCLTVIGALENTKKITESHLITILPSILKGLSSYSVDFACAAFMITTQLVVKTALTEKLLTSLITRICEVPFENMRSEIILVLSCIFQRQSENIKGFPLETLVKFVGHRWVSETIYDLNEKGVNTKSLVVELVKSCLRVIQGDNRDQANVCKAFLEKLMIDVRFVEEDVKNILGATLKCYKPQSTKGNTLKDGEVIELDSEEDEPMDETFHSWYCDFVQKFERQYPSEFDEIIKGLFNNPSTSKNVKQALKIVVSYRLDTATLSNSDSTVFENLYHYNSRNRVEGVKFLVKNFDELNLKSEKSSNILKETISDRLKDDNPKVLMEVLKIPTSKLIEKVSEDDLVDSLASIIEASQLQNGDYDSVLKSVVSHLSKCKSSNLKVVLATLPLTKPIIDHHQSIDLKSLPTINTVKFQEALNYNQENWTPLRVTYYLSLLESTISKTINEEDSQKTFEKLESLIKPFKVRHISKDDTKGVLSFWRNDQIPLFSVLSFYTQMVKVSKKLPPTIYKLFATKAFSNHGEEKQEYALALKVMLEYVFPKSQEKLEFLADFFAYEKVGSLKVSPELTVISLRLFNLVLQGKNPVYEITDLLILKVFISLCSEYSVIRECALETLGLLKSDNKIFKELLGKSEEIQMDGEQLPLLLCALMKKKSSEKTIGKFLNLLKTPSVDIFLKSKILNILKYVNTPEILIQMIPVAKESLNNEKTEGNLKYIDGAHVQILENVISRFDENSIGTILLDDPKAWDFLKLLVSKNMTFLGHDGSFVPISAMVIDLFDEEVFAQVPEKLKGELLCLIVSAISSAGNNTLFSKGNKFLKKCGINGKHVQKIFEKMFDCSGVGQKNKRKSVTDAIGNEVVNCLQWKEGVTLLELMENKKKIENSSHLIPLLFEILKVCLQIQEQSIVEYSKQLLLSALLHLCQKYQEDQKLKKKVTPLPESTFRIDLIVQCVRGSQNPQTHNQALLLLSHCAIVYPQQVLHNIMDIFTFMGSSVVRHDDVFSFQIISNIIESVIPTIVKKDNKESVDLVVPVFKVFADIILDVPEHRRLPLYTKLISTLGTGKYLWMFLCVVFEAHITHEDEDKKKTKIKSESTFPRLEICLQLIKTFSAQEILETCIQLMSYLTSLPEDVNTTKGNKMEVDLTDTQLFDVDARSVKQLRHYRYIIIQFVSNLTSSREFVNTMALLNEEETKSMKPLYQALIIKTLSYIPNVSTMNEKHTDSRYWKVCLTHCYDVLDNAISLLSPDMFAVVVTGLMQHKLLIIRRKIIDLLNNKLQHTPEYFESCDPEKLLNLLDPLKEIVQSILEKSSGDVMVYIQQSALVAIKLLSKLLAADNIPQFQDILDVLTTILRKNKIYIPKILSATIILSMVEISANLKVHCIVNLPRFMPLILEALQDQVEASSKLPPDNICIAIVTSILKIYDVIPLFMSPYVEATIKQISILWFRTKTYPEDAKSKVILNKLAAVWTKISNEVPSRITVPCVEKVYEQLMEEKFYEPISILMKLPIECFTISTKFEFKPVHQELTDLFLKSLEFRSTLSSHPNQQLINEIEEDIVNAFVSWVLKLSEGSFRPLYHKIYDWAIRNDQSRRENAITYFILSNKISQSLKSLFVLFASDFIEDAAELLNKCNQSKCESESESDSSPADVLLLKNIVNTLYNVFLYDSSKFVNPHRFDILMQPLVDQLENPLIIEDEEMVSDYIACVSQLAVAVSNDVLWKQLNYQILLKTRTNLPEVRIIAFNCCVEIARKLGEEFSTLLPETVPFVSELLEDDNLKVEGNTKRGVQELEKILGESLQKYF